MREGPGAIAAGAGCSHCPIAATVSHRRVPGTTVSLMVLLTNSFRLGAHWLALPPKGRTKPTMAAAGGDRRIGREGWGSVAASRA